MLQSMVVKLVVTVPWIFLFCDCKDTACCRVQFHFPKFIQFCQFVQVFLEVMAVVVFGNGQIDNSIVRRQSYCEWRTSGSLYIKQNMDPKTDHCGTPGSTFSLFYFSPSITTTSRVFFS